MKIFVTGASGYIGGSVAKVLLNAGHEVYGLVRSTEKAEAVRALGVLPVLGTLEDSALLIQQAIQADAVIHTADSDHSEAIETILTALKGSGKTFIHTSGSSVVGDDARGDLATETIYTEETPFIPMDIRAKRVDINNFVIQAGYGQGIRTIVIVPSMAYGKALGLDVESDQLPVIIRKSREMQAGVYVGKGLNRWSNVHISDLAELYLLALEKAPSSSYFYAENGEESYRDLAIYISHALGFEGRTISWPAADAIAELGDWARFAIASNSRVRAVKARELVGWNPKGDTVSQWINTLKA